MVTACEPWVLSENWPRAPRASSWVTIFMLLTQQSNAEIALTVVEVMHTDINIYLSKKQTPVGKLFTRYTERLSRVLFWFRRCWGLDDICVFQDFEGNWRNLVIFTFKQTNQICSCQFSPVTITWGISNSARGDISHTWPSPGLAAMRWGVKISSCPSRSGL